MCVCACVCVWGWLDFNGNLKIGCLKCPIGLWVVSHFINSSQSINYYIIRPNHVQTQRISNEKKKLKSV